MKTKKERMYDRITKHGENLKIIFNLSDDPVKISKRVRIVEQKAGRVALAHCNGDIDGDIADIEEKRILERLDKILNFKQQNIPVIFNRDPRGYTLKIDDEYVREHHIDIYRDWGGYGIIAPEFDGNR